MPTWLMRYFVRSASLTNYVDVARSLKLDPFRLSNEAGIGRAALLDPDLKIPVDAVSRLLESSAIEADVEDFGLRMAESRKLSNLGPLGLVVREQPTLRGALESIARYQRIHNEALMLRVEETDGVVIITEDVIRGRAGNVRQGTELIIGVLYRTLRLFLGPGWKPHSICFTHSAPHKPTIHESFFGIPIEFLSDFDGIVCDARDLERPMLTADPQMAKYVNQYVASIVERSDNQMRERVWQLIFALLPSGRCSADTVAQHLGVDRRTVYRHLNETNETFSSIVEAVRIELVTRYLGNDGRPIADVVGLLGFLSQSAFSRWFNGYFGCSVSAWRKTHRGVTDQSQSKATN